ncbi:MAG: hypothetical protein FWG10_00325 [Eubacteriaceae bacterium]|nr:hypothetical protein [Eubacteriaceae bacterium]
MANYSETPDESLKRIFPPSVASEAQSPADSKELVIAAGQAKSTKAALVRKTVYITEQQNKAIKLKIALSEDPKDKDLSSIVRTALDLYLNEGEM